METRGQDKPSEETSLFVDAVEITELAPRTLYEAQMEAAALRNFLNVFNNHLYVLRKNSRDALKQLPDDHALCGLLKEIARATSLMEAATKRLQGLIEGNSGGTILVVDDDELVKGLVVRALEGSGYTVFGASSAAEALEKCKAYPGRIDLVLADVSMEPMDGYELVKEILREKPTSKAIYMSGYPKDRARAMPGTEYLRKPDELSEGLLEKVRQMLRTV